MNSKFFALALSGAISCTTCSFAADAPEIDCRPKVCRPYVEVEKVEKSCFKVECERICIPAITFPWQKKRDSCGRPIHLLPRCGRIIHVNVLKKDSYETEKCVCDWRIEDVCPPLKEGEAEDAPPPPEQIPADEPPDLPEPGIDVPLPPGTNGAPMPPGMGLRWPHLIPPGYQRVRQQ